MIDELTKEKLTEYGFTPDHINTIMEDENYETHCNYGKGCYFVSMFDKRIYSGIERFEKTGLGMSFPFYDYNLFDEYYNVEWKVYSKPKRLKAGIKFNELQYRKRFKESQSAFAELAIKQLNARPATTRNIPSLHEGIKDKIEGYTAYFDWLEKMAENKTQDNDQWKDLIKIELHGRLNEVESKIESKIPDWKQRKKGALMECAAFCQLLFDLKYFVSGSTNRASVNTFSLSRYKVDILIQLGSGIEKNKSRETHKGLLLKYFK